MKKSKKGISNKTKEIIIKSLVILAGISQLVFVVIGFLIMAHIINISTIGDVVFTISLPIIIPSILIATTFKIASTFKKGEFNQKDYKIKNYDCTLDVDIESRMKNVYGEVKHSELNPKNYYSAYHKEHNAGIREAVIIAVMHVTEAFNEDEFVQFMNEIPEVNERAYNHTLVVVFIEEQKSSYLKEIMYVPEYNSLWDTKVFSVYDEAAKKLKVNKTNSGTGNTAFNDAKRELDRIFGFVKEPKKQKAQKE